MNRRRFMMSAVALAAAARSINRGGSSLIPARLQVPAAHLSPAVPILWGDGHHDDTEAMQAWGSGRPWRHADGTPGGKVISGKQLLLTAPIVVTSAGGHGLRLVNNFLRYTGVGDLRPTLQWLNA